MVLHPAYSIPFDQLIYGLEHEVNNGNVTKRSKGKLTQYTYSQQCTYEGNWNLFTMVARGIIVDHERIVAAPFPKFYNLSENKTVIPDLPFECFEKVDGSLIIAYHYEEKWHTATKGSFNSDQAKWAQEYLDKNVNKSLMHRGETWLFEAIYPENRIVVSYPKEELVLLGAYSHKGVEIPTSELEWYVSGPNGLNVRLAKSYSFSDLNSIVDHALTLSSQEEGYVIRYEDGTRVKIKGAEYSRVHALIAGITPLGIWYMMMNNDNLEFVRSQLPEEFLTDFDNIVSILSSKITTIVNKVCLVHKETTNLLDKDVGVMLSSFDDDVRKLIFPYRKSNGNLLEGRSREAVYRMIRPTGNVLPEYKPSSSMNRVQSDD